MFVGGRLSQGVLVAAALVIAGCGGHGALELAVVDPAGKSLGKVVDSESARLLLLELLTDDPQTYAAADLAPAPNQAQLLALGREVSVDYAALSFARAIGADEKSRAVQAAFARAIEDGAPRSEELLRRPGGFPYTVLFAPGWLYVGHPASGADFARQRKLLDRLGVANSLIETDESGSTENNAAMIAAAVHEAACRQHNLIVVSTSKAGPEVALALSRLIAPADAARIAGWVNAGGALFGTPLADYAIRPPLSWITRPFFWIAGWDRAGMTSMATEPSRQRLAGLRVPDSIAVVNLVAVPVSGSVGRKVYGGYRVLHHRGPNDGVVLLADSVWPGGANLVALGSDHLLTEFHEDTRGLAFLRAVDDAVKLHRSALDQAAALRVPTNLALANRCG